MASECAWILWLDITGEKRQVKDVGGRAEPNRCIYTVTMILTGMLLSVKCTPFPFFKLVSFLMQLIKHISSHQRSLYETNSHQFIKELRAVQVESQKQIFIFL